MAAAVGCGDAGDQVADVEAAEGGVEVDLDFFFVFDGGGWRKLGGLVVLVIVVVVVVL